MSADRQSQLRSDNMKQLTFFLFFSALIASKTTNAQDTLPNFSLKNIGNNRIIIGWVNSFSNIRQITIQRSFDSLSGFKSLLSVTDPSSTQNGYVDTKAITNHMFYRLYIMLDKGVFFFSDSKQPVADSMNKTTIPIGTVKLPELDKVAIPVVKDKPVQDGYLPSLHVYTQRDGYVQINLPPDEKSKKYSIKFFEESGHLLFELKELKEKNFKIDKTNFYHAGWFRFELFEDGKLLEKNKFYLEKDF